MTIQSNSTAPYQPGISTPPSQGGGGSQASQPHPDYSARQPDWTLMFDTNEGQRHIKSKTSLYLPATTGMAAMGLKAGDTGAALYTAYLTRAFFPDLVKETNRALVGILDQEPANIELPAALEPMRENATPKGESLNDLLIQMHLDQLLYGRLGLLLDVDEVTDLPLIVEYPAPQVINWDDITETDAAQQDEGKRTKSTRKTVLVVLDETRYERDTGSKFDWNLVSRYRVLDLGSGQTSVFTSTVERDGSMQESVVPEIKGKTLDKIPFVFVNTTDLATKPGEVPLINLANLALAIYRGEADHRSALFMSGQDTLVVIGTDLESTNSENPGADSSPIIGSGAYLNLPDPDADAKFIGPDSDALSEQRTSLEDDYRRAGEEGIKLLSSGAGAEAAETMKIRVASRTATLQTVAMTAASGLESILRTAAEWVGANPDEVKVEPNLDFVTDMQDPKDLIAYAQAKKAGVPLSWQSVHNLLRQKDYTELTFEQELEQIKEENDREELQGGSEGMGEEDEDINIDDPALRAAAEAAAQAADEE